MDNRDSPSSVDDTPRAEHVEAILEATECLTDDEQKYPVRSEELATEYADQLIDLPNETESLGSVFDRLVDRQFDSAVEAREAVLNQLTGAEAGPEEYNDQRDLEELAADVAVTGAMEGDEEE